MLFPSVSFLYLFLPVTIAAYYVAPKRAKNYVLLAASLLFYFFGEPKYTLLLAFSSLSAYVHGLLIERYRGKTASKLFLASSVVISVALLGFFKYADFVVDTLNSVIGSELPLLSIALPLGVSFFTFQTMSYTIDVYRGQAKAEKNPAKLATYVCLFPQLIAGPIVRYTDVADELNTRRVTLDDFADGIRRFIYGLGKKVLIANAMAELCAAFANSGDKSVLFMWMYALAFTLQVYFDFSGYSDMAIGLGRLFGFHFPENFNYPFIAQTITEFWRRWHMTLSGWFRDYVYIPLGGSRVNKFKWIRNIFIVWLLTGLWHGASWNFVLWGLYFGALLLIEKLFLGKLLKKVGALLRYVYMALTLLISFVIFNGNGLQGAFSDVAAMFGGGGLPVVSFEALYYLKSYAVIIAAALIGGTPLIKMLLQRIRTNKAGNAILNVLEPVSIALILIVVTAYLVDGSFNPFLYFRF